jgi:hypothetical protein
MLAVIFATALVLLAFMGRTLIVQAGKLIGTIIRRRTEERRQLLLAKYREEEDDYFAGTKAASTAEDDEWEKVENHSGRSAKNGQKGEDPWKGIVAFFHPFW